MPPSAATLDADRATSGVATAAAALSAMIAAGERRGGAVARAAAGESSIDVVEELLSENERLRFIIEDMSDEVLVESTDAGTCRGVSSDGWFGEDLGPVY